MTEAEGKGAIDLGKGLQLVKTDLETFFLYWACYSDFWDPQGLASKSNPQSEYSSYCYFIIEDGKCIGGVIIRSNLLSRFFLIPPKTDAFLILQQLKALLISYSNENLPIIVSAWGVRFREDYQRVGFRLFEVRRWMIRPTERFIVDWSKDLYIRPPDRKDIAILTELSMESYQGGVDEFIFLQRLDLNDPGSKVQEIFKNFNEELISFFQGETGPALIDASSVVFEKSSNRLVGACLMSEWNGFPLVYDLCVSKPFQGKAIATNLLKHALTVLYKKHKLVRLFVTLGNPAETLYYNLGFFPGMPNETLAIFPSKA